MNPIVKKLTTAEQYAKLISNGLPENTDQDHAPVVCWYCPTGIAKWLVSEIVDEETAFGLCDLGFGYPELGYIHLPDLEECDKSFMFGIDRKTQVLPNFPMSVYAEAARKGLEITTHSGDLEAAVKELAA
jgi:Protein of unknown function (DUF2958)